MKTVKDFRHLEFKVGDKVWFATLSSRLLLSSGIIEDISLWDRAPSTTPLYMCKIKTGDSPEFPVYVKRLSNQLFAFADDAISAYMENLEEIKRDMDEPNGWCK